MAEATQEEVLAAAIQEEALVVAEDVQVVSVEDFQAVQATIHHITEVQEARITDGRHHHHRDRDIMADRQEECTMVPVVHHHADVCLVSLYLR